MVQLILIFKSSWWKIASAARNLFILSPKRLRRPLHSLLYKSFFYDGKYFYFCCQECHVVSRENYWYLPMGGNTLQRKQFALLFGVFTNMDFAHAHCTMQNYSCEMPLGKQSKKLNQMKLSFLLNYLTSNIFHKKLCTFFRWNY